MHQKKKIEFNEQLICEGVTLYGKLSVHVANSISNSVDSENKDSENEIQKDFEVIVEFINWCENTFLPLIQTSIQ